jgi:aminopeptidase YwaD
VNLIDELAAKIGVRTAGSDEAHRSAEAIADSFRELGLEPTFQDFQFVGYEPETPTLTVDGVSVMAAPCVYSHPTPAAGVHGTLRYLGRHVVIENLFEPFAFAVEYDGKELARIYGNPLGGGAVPFPSGYGQVLTGPAAYISTADAERLRQITGSSVDLRTGGRFVPGQHDRNVVARLEGHGRETVIVCAHFDSVWRGPGAVDNATGVEGIRRLAERLRGATLDRTVVFVAFAAEEIGLLGSRFFVTEAKLHGDLDNIVGVVNLDCIAHGERFLIRASPEQLRERALAIAADLGLANRNELVALPAGGGSDDFSFSSHGISRASLLHWPYPQYHLPEDRRELVDERRLADSVELAGGLVRYLASAPALVTSPL